MDARQSVRLPPSQAESASPVSTRLWLSRTHRDLAPLLPQSSHTPLINEELVAAPGESVDAFEHFCMEPDKLQNLLKNFKGLKLSAQAAARGYCIDQEAEAWPGFEQVWVPIRLKIDQDLKLSGRLGWARDENGHIKDADCIVVLPGLFGDHGVKRSQDLCVPLREAGFHVLHLELRGHGQTEHRYPNLSHTFGINETDDLMQVSDWLEQQPHVRRTGLIGYCWLANIALYAAWYDGKLPDDPMESPAIRPTLSAYDPAKRRFRAGVMAFSPVVRWEVLMDELDYQRSRWKHPIFAAIQDTVRDRQKRKGFEVNGNLRQLIENEFERYETYGVKFPNGSREAYSFLRLLEYKGQPTGDKLEFVRVPVLIVHGADDPLIPCQEIADLMATVRNEKVAAAILPSGGHVGFSSYCPEYYLSLITNFFDPQDGPAALQEKTRPPTHAEQISRFGDGGSPGPAQAGIPLGESRERSGVATRAR